MNRTHSVTTVEELGGVPKNFGKGDVVVIYLRGKSWRHALALLCVAATGTCYARAKLATSVRGVRFWGWLTLRLYALTFFALRRGWLRVS